MEADAKRADVGATFTRTKKRRAQLAVAGGLVKGGEGGDGGVDWKQRGRGPSVGPWGALARAQVVHA